MSQDDRLVDLESRLAFQDEAIEGLQAALLAQQRQMDQLAGQIQRLQDRLRAITPSPLDSDEAEPPPPHY